MENLKSPIDHADLSTNANIKRKHYKTIMHGLEEKILAIIFSLSILGIARFSRGLTGTYLAPAGIFSICWFFFTIFPLMMLAKAPINPIAILYIATAALVFSLSAAPFNWKAALESNKKGIHYSRQFDTKFLRSATYAAIVAAIFFSFATVINNGLTVNQIIFDLIRTSGQYAAVRGSDGMEYGLIGMLGTLTTYLAPVLGGLINSELKKKWLLVVCILPSLLTMVVQSSKLVFLIAVCFYVAGAVVGRLLQRKLELPKIRNPGLLIAGVALASILVLISFVSRLGSFEIQNLDTIAEPLAFSIASYTLGQIYAFSDFFSFATHAPSVSSFKEDFYSYGAYTFNSVFATLGIGKDFPPGMYEETGWYSDVFETNVFTVFRGLIYDFGILGSLISLFLIGLISHIATYHTLVQRKPWAAVTAFIAITVFILMGYLFSVFVARYALFTSLVLWLLLQANSRLNQIR